MRKTPQQAAGLMTAALGCGGADGRDPATATTIAFSDTRIDISPPGDPAGRCASAVTVNFSPGAYAAFGTSNLGDFTFVASHCIADPPPGDLSDGEFVWTFADGTLWGTHDGTISLSGTPGVFDAVENLVFLGGTGAFAGYKGWVTSASTVVFGLHEGQPASFGDGVFNGKLTLVSESATWAILIAGFGLVGAKLRRRAGTTRAYAPVWRKSPRGPAWRHGRYHRPVGRP